MQLVGLKNLELDLGLMREEIRRLDKIDETSRATTTQKVTQLEHKLESALQGRYTTHLLL